MKEAWMRVLLKEAIDLFKTAGFVEERRTKKNTELSFEGKVYVYFYYSSLSGDEDIKNEEVYSRTPLGIVVLHPEVFDVSDFNSLSDVKIDVNAPYRRGSNLRRFPKKEGETSPYGLKLEAKTFSGVQQILAKVLQKINPNDLSLKTQEDTLATWLLMEDMDTAFDYLEQNSLLDETTKEALIKARKGQEAYRRNVMSIEKSCRVTGLSHTEFLIASHIKPWRDSNNEERLDGHNGLLLSPHIDKLFDKGFISFNDDGSLLISPLLDTAVLSKWCISSMLIHKQELTAKQKYYMEYHRKYIFQK